MAKRVEDVFFNNLENLGEAKIRVYDKNLEDILYFSIRKNCDENTFTTFKRTNGNNIDTQIRQSIEQLREFIKKMSLELESLGDFKKAQVNGSEIILKF